MTSVEKDPIEIYIDRHRLVPTKDVLKLVGMSRSTLDRWRARGDFPQPAIKQGKTKLWLIGDIHNWLEKKINNGG